MVNEVNNLIDALSVKLSVTADSILPEIIKYKIIEHLFWFVISIICFVVVWKVYKYYQNIINEREKEVIEKTHSDGWCPIKRLTWDNFFAQETILICLFLLGIAVFIYGLYVIPWLIVPTGSVINYILSLI